MFQKQERQLKQVKVRVLVQRMEINIVAPVMTLTTVPAHTFMAVSGALFYKCGNICASKQLVTRRERPLSHVVGELSANSFCLEWVISSRDFVRSRLTISSVISPTAMPCHSTWWWSTRHCMTDVCWSLRRWLFWH